MTHLLVSNDFPPKTGGIQTYLWELWRRLPPDSFAVLTTHHTGADTFDRDQPFRVVRRRDLALLPTQSVAAQIHDLAAEIGATLVVLDPALPLGQIGSSLRLPYAVVIHGAEVTVPARVPGAATRLARVLRGARGIVAAGRYPAAEAARLIGDQSGPGRIVEVPPGVDLERFRPLTDAQKQEARERLGFAKSGPLVLVASRLVPRKGADVVIEALPYLVPRRQDLTLAVAGQGRDLHRLRVIAGRLGVTKRVRFMGRVPDEDLADLYACADVFAMLCRNRWAGLEQEGFGIVFLEAAAAGVPQVAGDSGGAAEAVADGETGYVLHDPKDPGAVAATLAKLLDDADLRRRMGTAARARAEQHFSWHDLADRLGEAFGGVGLMADSSKARRKRKPRKPMPPGHEALKKPRNPMPPGAEAQRRVPQPDVELAAETVGAGIVRSSIVGTVLLGVTTVAGAADPHDLAAPALVVALALFFGGVGAFGWSYFLALGRSRESEIGLAGLYGLSGSAPPRLRVKLFGLTGVQLAIALVGVAIRPYSSLAFGLLSVMWGLGMVGMWGARYGAFPPRPPERGGRRGD